MRNPAPGRMRRKPAHEPRGDRRGGGTSANQNNESRAAPAVCPFNDRIAHVVSLVQAQPKRRAHESRRRPDHERHNREHDQVTMFERWFLCMHGRDRSFARVHGFGKRILPFAACSGSAMRPVSPRAGKISIDPTKTAAILDFADRCGNNLSLPWPRNENSLWRSFPFDAT